VRSMYGHLEARLTRRSVSQGCIVGKSSINAGVLLQLDPTVNASFRSVALLPGSYSLATTAMLGNSSNITLPLQQFASASPQPATGFLASGSLSTRLAVALNTSMSILFYPQAMFSGSPALHAAQTASLSANSILMPPDAYVRLEVTASKGAPQQVTVFDSVADLSQWTLQPSSSGALKVLDFQSTACREPCASTGRCSAEGQCVCQAGYGGTTCSESSIPSPRVNLTLDADTCLPGFFGPSCTPCSCSTGSTCSDGVTGSGLCSSPSNVTTASQTCDCLNGVCTGTSACSCNAGWADDPNGGQRCSICAAGFALSSSGDCLACLPGCSSCNSNKCSTCQAGLQISAGNAQACEPVPFLSGNSSFTQCGEGAFNSRGACLPCDRKPFELSPNKAAYLEVSDLRHLLRTRIYPVFAMHQPASTPEWSLCECGSRHGHLRQVGFWGGADWQQRRLLGR
jgi:hypothetical protein